MFFSSSCPSYRFQVQMFDRTSGFMVNASSIFTKEEDLQWYLYLTSNLIQNFRFVVHYHTYVATSIYQYNYHCGSYEYTPNLNPPTESEINSNTGNTTFTKDERQDDLVGHSNTEPDINFVKYEDPPVFGIPDNNLPQYTPSVSESESESEITNQNTTRAATSGFNFHFDPPTNININIQESNIDREHNVNTDNIEWQVADSNVSEYRKHNYEDSGSGENTFMVYHSNFMNQNNGSYSQEENQVNELERENVISEMLEEIEDESDISDLGDVFIKEELLATSTPPPVEDDYWNVLEQESYDQMTLHKYGRGYLLKCDEENPDFGTKYFPSEENCRAWWQPANQAWFVRRENKNYFLERGVEFVYRNNKRSRH